MMKKWIGVLVPLRLTLACRGCERCPPVPAASDMSGAPLSLMGWWR